MFSPRTAPGSGRRHQGRVTGRKSVSGSGGGFMFSPRRTPMTARSTPTRVQNHTVTETVYYDVQTFGSSLPVKVMEALTMADADDPISVKVNESGWAWMVCGERLIIWKICQTAVAKLSVCKELQLPSSEFTYTADLVALTSAAPLRTATVQSVSILAVAAEGTARFWPSLAHEGIYTESDVNLGDLCNFVVALRGGSFVLSSVKNQLLRASSDSSGKLQYRALQQGQGVLSGIGRRVSSLFGILSPPANDELYSVLWVEGTSCLYSLTSSTVSKWEVDDSTEHQIFSWDTRKALTESIVDSIWGSESNYEELKEGANVTYLDMKSSQLGLVVLAAAWHPSDSPCLAYFCLVTLQETGDTISDQFTVEVTKYSCPFQSEEELQATRFVLPDPPGTTAVLYNKEMVSACSTGTSRAALPDEKISFNSPGDGIRGGGCCSNLPVFFSKNSGLVAVVARESASILPETMEDSLCSSLAAAPEISSMETPTRSEPVAQEDKTKLLKAAFLQFCRNDLVGAQTVTDDLFTADADGEEGAELDAVVFQINLELVDDYPASDPRWAESVLGESAGFPLTSLIILHQLEDKMKAHCCFMDFLLQVGLLDRLSQVTVRSSPMATRLLLCEHAEKLQAAMVLKNHHNKHAELVNRAINVALQRSNTAVPPSLTAADVFFREVSQISLLFDCLVEEEERILKENPVDSEQWADVVLTVNNILKNFSDFLFRWYMEKGKRGKLLAQPAAQHQQLASFLQSHQHLSWLHHICINDFQNAHRTLYSQANKETRYFVKKKTLLALSKLTALASDLPQHEISKQVDDIVEQERFLLHQETLPKRLLEEKEQNLDTMPLLNAHNLIQLYICDDNRQANEYDFKKALDLLEYIDEEDSVDIDSLKCEILSKALRRDDWSSADGSDDPLEAAKDSIFVKILLKLIQEGVPLQTYLPDVKELLEQDELSTLKSKPYFEFVLRANYEHYFQAQM
ncbi:nuclear pore complex protein Nup133 isoform X2 [Xiphophorus couchianus]|uniref:nuclear pore complex protein Nup133 isoform X2 n=1 Tax=Xiphophorus couchianus TaxID=32473 RepID=UPI001016D67D|nr:nuclear pore complex protein Nup133 isoform X2 [Xiphophorus couchianus]